MDKLYYGMIGEHPKMQEVYHLIEMAATNDFTVLIQGETGTGKELVANAIHKRSQRQKFPFVVINCAAIPHELAESELFGHEKGAFTSAIKDRLGKIELAEKGSIFFDEIGEMDLSLQAKLLRVLEDKVINRVGSAKYRHVNSRMIAATNKCLKTKSVRGTFRDDLFHRLSVFQIILPPLRERKEDIPALVRYFLSLLNKQLKKDISSIDPAVMEELMEYEWHGNIRELKNVLTRAVIMSNGNSLILNNISISNHYEPTIPNQSISMSFSNDSNGTQLEEMERVAIKKMLVVHGGNKRKTAEALGIGRSSLYWKLKRYGIEAN